MYDQAAYDRGYKEGYIKGNETLTCTLYDLGSLGDPEQGFQYSLEYDKGWMAGCLDGNTNADKEMAAMRVEYDRGYLDGVAAMLAYEEADKRPLNPCPTVFPPSGYEYGYDWGFYDGCWGY